MSRRRVIALLGIALLYTAANLAKPLHIDDAFFYEYAKQVAASPTDPYGFQVYWGERPEPAMEYVGAPVLPYWWGLGLSVVGDNPILWKLWLLPFPLLFVFALHSILRRIAPGVELLVVMSILGGPAFLPAFNMMLDVPSMALAITAIAMFMRLAESSQASWRSYAGAVAIGVVAALAAQTKYTAIGVPAVLFAYALIAGRARAAALVATIVATVLFVTWEVLMLRQYGHSHFMLHAGVNGGQLHEKIGMLLPFVAIAGSLAPAVIVWALAGLGARGSVVAATLAVIPAVFVAIAVVPAGPDQALAFGLSLGLGAAVVVSVLAIVCRLLRRAGQWSWPSRTELFALAWLAIEVALLLSITPYPAARRLMGVVCVMFVVAGCVVCRRSDVRARRSVIAGTATSLVLGATFAVVDLAEARAPRTALDEAAAWIQRNDVNPSPTVWFAGHWGLKFYAERAGYRAVVAGRFPTRTELHDGDWLLIPHQRVAQQRVVVPAVSAQLEHVFAINDRLPYRTVIAYYAGRTGLERRMGPRYELRLYRVTRDVFLPFPPE